MTTLSKAREPGESLAGFEATTINRTGTIELEMTPAQVQPLFTAPGEQSWIPDWDPVILHGDGYEKGTVFLTTNHGPTTYWLVSDYDTVTGHAQYVRVTPGAYTGTVDVSISPTASGGSVVRVSYQLTGLSQAGNAELLDAFSEEKYAEMMQEWIAMINNCGSGFSRDQVPDNRG